MGQFFLKLCFPLIMLRAHLKALYLYMNNIAAVLTIHFACILKGCNCNLCLKCYTKQGQTIEAVSKKRMLIASLGNHDCVTESPGTFK